MQSLHDIEAKIEALDAYIDSFDFGTDAAIKRIGQKQDPDSISRLLSVLIDAGYFEKAANLVRNRPPHLRWAERAIYALVANGEIPNALAVLDWAKDNGSKIQIDRCLLSFGTSSFDNLIRNRPQSDIRPGALKGADKLVLAEAARLLAPIVKRVENAGASQSELEAIAVDLTIRIQILENNRTGVDRLVNVIINHKPLKLAIADAVRLRIVPIIPDIVNRLRNEHPESSKAHLLAVLIECDVLNRRAEAFEHGLQMLTEGIATDDRSNLLQFLGELAQTLGEAAIFKFESLIANEAELPRLFTARRLLQQGRLDEAAKIIDQTRNEKDPLWLQLCGHLRLQRNDIDAALTYFTQASNILDNSELFKRVAQLAYKHDRYTIAISALERVLVIDPGDIATLQNLAALCLQTKNLPAACEHFRALLKIKPRDVHYALNLAIALVRSNQLEEALVVYNDACLVQEPNLQAWIGRSQLLKMLNQPSQALDSLAPVRDVFWNDITFVSTFVDLAFAASSDDEGQKGLLQLQSLQQSNKDAPQVLQPISFDQLKAFALERQRLNENALSFYRKGVLPWLLVERNLQNSMYLGWNIRTQNLSFMWEDPNNHSRFTTYSTNGFTVRKHNEVTTLVPIACPPKSTPIVIDLSSIYTLHGLGLLTTAADYFETIYFPSDYLDQMFGESMHLVPHQPSIKTAHSAILDAINSDRITVIDSDPLDLRTGQEHEKIQLSDIVTELHRIGRLNDLQFQVIQSAVPALESQQSKQAIQPAQQIRLNVPILSELIRLNILESTLDCFDVRINEADCNLLKRTVNDFVFLENVAKRHADLWKVIRNDKRFIQLSSSISPNEKRDTKTDNIEGDIVFAGFRSNQQGHLPLLVDDRTCQMAALNSKVQIPLSAFGSDQLLLALNSEQMISDDLLADSFIQLIRWRYRFLVPSGNILKTLALRFRDHPPGVPLREIAMYFHSSMNDPGLFIALEPTTQPATVGTRLWQTFLATLSEFLLSVWEDSRFSDSSARAITEWAITECIPLMPSNLGPVIERQAHVIAKSILSMVIVASVQSDNHQRVNQCLKSVAEVLEIDEGRFLYIVTGVINVLAK